MSLAKEEVLAVIRKSANEIAGTAPEDITETATMADLQLDSLDIVEVVCDIEETLRVEIDDSVFSEDMTIGDFIEKLVKTA